MKPDKSLVYQCRISGNCTIEWQKRSKLRWLITWRGKEALNLVELSHFPFKQLAPIAVTDMSNCWLKGRNVNLYLFAVTQILSCAHQVKYILVMIKSLTSINF